MKPIITVSDVSKTFIEDHAKRIVALEHVSFNIREGEFFVILGPSGSGKSTLLRIMSGLEKSYEGHVAYEEGMTPQDRSFVFQQFALLPWLSVRDNVALPHVARHSTPSLTKQNVNRELARLGLVSFAGHNPRDLSGGMRQRVGIARALVTDPKIIFLDEPFSELDSFTAQALRTELLTIWKETKPTIIMVTHLIEEALELGDRIAITTSRPGRIEKIVDNPLPRPREKRSKDFFAMEDKLYTLVSP